MSLSKYFGAQNAMQARGHGAPDFLSLAKRGQADPRSAFGYCVQIPVFGADLSLMIFRDQSNDRGINLARLFLTASASVKVLQVGHIRLIAFASSEGQLPKPGQAAQDRAYSA